MSEVLMSKLVLRVECQGEVLGEFPLEGESLVLRLQDGDSGRLISTLTIEPAEAEQPVQPARARLEGLPRLSASGDLFQDETVDLVLSNDDTLARGVAEIRARAGSAPGTINVQLPSSRSEPELLELSETTGASGALELSPDEQGPDTLRLEKPEPLPVDREAVTARSRPGEARLGPLAVSPPEPERTEPEPPLPAAPEQDRSITRNLSDEMQELIAAAARRTHEAAEEGRPTITEPLASEESARPTFVEPDEVGELEAEGPPTRVSRDPFLPQPIAPQEPGVHGGEETRSVSDHEAGTELQDESEPVVGTDFADDDDEPVTVVAKTPSSERGAAQAARAAVLDEELRSARHPEDPGLVGPTAGYDEMPVPPQDRRQYDDDLSLSLPFEPGLTDASIGELSLPVPALTDERSEFSADLSLSLPLPVGLYEAASDDDITLPLPEEGSDASAESQRLVEIVQERTVTSGIGAMKLDTLGEPQPVQPRLLDTTGGFERDPSTERLEGAEVWFRRHGEWTPRGALNLGQHVQAFGGMVRCDDSGGLVVLAGPRLHGSATLPSGELRQINSGQQAIHLPAGTSVIMWQGEQGIYVRSNVAPDASGPVLDQGPVVYRRPPRSRAWKPPASDLDET
jgi:hypothetical protein